MPAVPRAPLKVWVYELILQKYYPELVSRAGIPALELLCDLLEKTIRLSSKEQRVNEGGEDYSYIWRPAIGEHTQNRGHSLRDALISGIRDASILIVGLGHADIEDVVEILERRQWKIFHRIALHVLKVSENQGISLVAARLCDRMLFDDVTLRHEYVDLLRQSFLQLPPEQQRMILGWIDAGPDVKRSQSEQEIAGYRETWKLKWLASIGIENLPEEWREKYQSLVDTYGVLERPEFPICTPIGGWGGPPSPKTADELKAMSDQDIIEFLQGWTPSETIFGESPRESLRKELSSAVAEDPGRFANIATRFQCLDSIYVCALLSCLQEGCKHRQALNCLSVLELCGWVIHSREEIRELQVKNSRSSSDWNWMKKEIAELLSEGFHEGAA